jgi:hypothetical protein
VTVVEGEEASGKQGYGIHVDYEDGTSEDVLVGELRDAQKAAREAVEIGEAYLRKLMEDASAPAFNTAGELSR